MCPPLIAALPAIIAGVSAASSATGLIIQGVGAANAGAAAEEQAKQNAKLAESAAADATQRGAVDAARPRAAASQAIGEQRAAAGESGVQVDTGTVGELAEKTRLSGELDALTIRNNAAREAWGLKTQAIDIRNQGRYARDAGNAQALGAGFAAGGTLLTAGADIYKKGKEAKFWGGG